MRSIKQTASKILEKLFPEQMEVYAVQKKYRENRKNVRKYRSMPREQYPRVLEEFYRSQTGLTLDIEHPRRFTEKIQWRKLYDVNPVYSRLSDKYAVREWVEKKLGKEYLIPLLGVWKKPEDIDYDALPSQFVLKTNHASAANILVQDKSKLNKRLANQKLRAWLGSQFAYSMGLELHYLPIEPLVIAEQYMLPDAGETDLKDYKFLCFHGRPYYCWVDLDRYHGHKRKFYDMDWNPQEFHTAIYGPCDIDVPCPERFEEMKQIAQKLSEGFAHVRVDLYEIGGRVYFGEMTFTSGNGIEVLEPVGAEIRVGDLWDITVPQVEEELVGL